MEVMREAKDDWIGTRCRKIETCLNKNNSKTAYYKAGNHVV